MVKCGIIGGVLVGGRSHRMGTCKALLRIGDRTFIEHIVEAILAVTDEVVLLGEMESIPASLQGMTILADEPGTVGPLAGLSSLLEYSKDRWGLLVACDMPLIQSRLLEKLTRACTANIDAVAFRVRENGHDYFPCCVVFHPRSRAQVGLELNHKRSLRGLLERIRCRNIDLELDEARSLLNINSPEDYQRLQVPR